MIATINEQIAELTGGNPNELLTEDQTAVLLTVTPATLAIWRCTRRYALAYVKVGRLVRYRRHVVEAWLESRTESGK